MESLIAALTAVIATANPTLVLVFIAVFIIGYLCTGLAKLLGEAKDLFK